LLAVITSQQQRLSDRQVERVKRCLVLDDACVSAAGGGESINTKQNRTERTRIGNVRLHGEVGKVNHTARGGCSQIEQLTKLSLVRDLRTQS
jgi:hypothetical protein